LSGGSTNPSRADSARAGGRPRPDHPAQRCNATLERDDEAGIKSLVGFPNAIRIMHGTSGSKTKRPNSRLPFLLRGWAFGSIHPILSHPIPFPCKPACMALPWPRHRAPTSSTVQARSKHNMMVAPTHAYIYMQDSGASKPLTRDSEISPA
jgi:hypothetical protein